MTHLKLPALILSGLVLTATAGLTQAAESRFHRQQLLEQQAQQLHIHNRGEDRELRNRIRELSGKGNLLRQWELRHSQSVPSPGGNSSRGR